MKRFFYLFIFFGCSLLSYAQHGDSDKIKSLKIAHLTTVLNLTTEEAEKFWPIYNTYDNQLFKLRHSEIIKYTKSTDIEDIERLSEKQAKEKVQDLLDFEDEYCTLRNKFIQDCKKILSNKKILLLKKAEDDFNRKLLKKYKDKK